MAPAQSRAVRVGSATGLAALLASGGFHGSEVFTAGAHNQRVPTTARQVRQATAQASVASSAAPSSAQSAPHSLMMASALAVLASGVAGARATSSSSSRGSSKLALAATATASSASLRAFLLGDAVRTPEIKPEPEVPPTPPPFDPSTQVGAVEPLGFFDPLGFTQVGNEKGFKQLRAAEIKHGRVAMMASIGAIAQPFLKLPVFDFPNAAGTFGALANGRVTFGLFALFVASGVLELLWQQREDREAGNFGDPFGVDMYTDEMRTKEISNGRMAMISMLGIFAAELATGKNAIEQLTLFAGADAAAPAAPAPFDPAAQLGAVEPLGFFDPLGFTQVGNEKGFKQLRAAEIKHGRVAMMASIGAIAQPFLKLPVFDFPNAAGTFGALANGRVTFGLFALFVASGVLELLWQQREDREAGNFGDPFGVDMYTDEMRTKEISNGRMAMISMLGIFAAELATGKNAIEQLNLL